MPDLWMDVDTALSEVPVNIMPLIDDTDFKTREESVVYNQSGLDLVWNFVTTAGAFTQTAVTPTESAGDYDWTNQGNGMYTIEIPASGGASINNDTEGHGWFTGFATGILPWRGPVIGFRASGLNDALIDSAYSATRGLAGTALPAAAADAAGGLIVSDLGGLDADAQAASVTAIETDTSTTLDNLVDDLESRLGTPGDLGGGATVSQNLSDLAGATFNTSTDSNEAIRNHIGDGTNLTEAGGDGDHLTAIDLPDQTMNVTGNITGNLSGSVGSVTGNVGGTVSELGTQAKADVNAEVVDALATDTYAEPGQGAPAATTTLAAKINYLYKAWRNKKDNDGSTTQFYADDGSTVDQKQTTSQAAGTVTKAEIVSGP